MDKTQLRDIARALTQFSALDPGYEKAERYYDGDQAEVFASRKLQRALSKTGTSFRINFAKTPVDAVLNRLEIASLNSTDEEARRVLSRVWEANELDQEADEVHRWSLVYGEGYIMVWPNEDGETEILWNSPRTLQLFYDEETGRKKEYAAKLWREGDRNRLNLYYPDRIEKYISKNEKPKKADEYEEYEEEVIDPFTGEETKAWPLENPFGEVPVFHFRTQRQKPRPEHADAYGPQDMLNKLVITQMASNDYHGFPQRYVLSGGNPSNEATDFDEDDDNAVESTDLTSGPGELWWLTGEGLKVGQFDAADADAFLKPFEQYVRAMASVTATPLHYFEGMREAPSGESLRSAEAPLVKKVSKRMLSFGGTWKDVFRFVLSIEDIAAPVDIRWASAQTMDDKEAWEAAKAKQEAGVPVAQTLLEAGYSDDQVKDFMELAQAAVQEIEETEDVDTSVDVGHEGLNK